MNVLLICNSIAVGMLALIWTTKTVADTLIKFALFALFIANLFFLAIELGIVVRV